MLVDWGCRSIWIDHHPLGFENWSISYLYILTLQITRNVQMRNPNFCPNMQKLSSFRAWNDFVLLAALVTMPARGTNCTVHADCHVDYLMATMEEKINGQQCFAAWNIVALWLQVCGYCILCHDLVPESVLADKRILIRIWLILESDELCSSYVCVRFFTEDAIVHKSDKPSLMQT